MRNESINHDISFVGKIEGKPSRFKILNYLNKEGFNVSTFGSSDENNPNYLSVNDMYSVFNNSAINLSFSGVTFQGNTASAISNRIRGNKARPLEILAANGFCLCEFSISTSKFLKDGEEMMI